MTYREFVYDVFREDNDSSGVQSYSDIEIEDLIIEESFSKIEKYLIDKGYDLKRMYENEY